MNCLLKHIIEGNLEIGVEVRRRLGGRRKKLFCDVKITTGYWKLKDEVLDLTVLGTKFGSVVR